MDRRKFSISVVAAAVLAGCGGGSDGEGGSDGAAPDDPSAPPSGALPEFASATALPVTTAFAQTVEPADYTRGMAPGQANLFDLRPDFAIADGFGDQFDGALALEIEIAGTTIPFPADQAYADLTALGPEMDAGDGVRAVTFTTDPSWVLGAPGSAVLHPVRGACLQQAIDLSGLAPQRVDLTWSGNSAAGAANFPDEPFHVQVVVYDMDGRAHVLYRRDATGTTGHWGLASLDAFSGQRVVLSFEQSAPSGVTVLDDVSVLAPLTMTEHVTNGNFAAGAVGWQVPPLRVAQNVRSGVRAVPGLGSVQRSFYTQPDALWGRMADVFTNGSGSALRARITYRTNLGSNGAGVVYPVPGAAGRALGTWDAAMNDRDAGLVFGAGATATGFRSPTRVDRDDGSDQIDVAFDIDVPAGGSVTLLNFVVLTGMASARRHVTTDGRAEEVDAIAADIANNFRTKLAYQRGLTREQLDTLLNF